MTVQDSVLVNICQLIEEHHSTKITVGIVNRAAEFYEECSDDFCLQEVDGDALTFGTLEEITWRPIDGFSLSEDCSLEFETHFEEIIDHANT